MTDEITTDDQDPTEDTEAHMPNRRAVEPADDAEGHRFHWVTKPADGADPADEEDAEGHRFHWVTKPADGADPSAEGDDAEGHHAGTSHLEPADDAEGHHAGSTHLEPADDAEGDSARRI